VRARSTTIRGDPRSIDEGVAYLRDEALPAMQQMDGFIGPSVLAERLTGRCIVTSAWTDPQSLHASDARIRPMREEMARRFGGPVEVQDWDVVVLHRVHRTAPGACARVTWARAVHEPLDRFVPAYRSNLMPRLEELPGFCSLSLLVDPHSGRSVGVESFENRETLQHTRGDARALREEFSSAMGAQVTEVAEMDLVLAHLRVPETV
jgi:hypothetical protein